jgi:hypothetical protein
VDASDSIGLDHAADFQPTDLNEYNWRIVAAERDLEMWKAKFEVSKKRWLLTEQLLALNQDDLAIVQSLAESTGNQLAQWKETLKSLEGELKTLQAADSDIPLQGVIQNRMNETKNLMAWVENALLADAAVINNLSSHIDRLSSIKEPLSEEVADRLFLDGHQAQQLIRTLHRREREPLVDGHWLIDLLGQRIDVLCRCFHVLDLWLFHNASGNGLFCVYLLCLQAQD